MSTAASNSPIVVVHYHQRRATMTPHRLLSSVKMIFAGFEVMCRVFFSHGSHIGPSILPQTIDSFFFSEIQPQIGQFASREPLGFSTQVSFVRVSLGQRMSVHDFRQLCGLTAHTRDTAEFLALNVSDRPRFMTGDVGES